MGKNKLKIKSISRKKPLISNHFTKSKKSKSLNLKYSMINEQISNEKRKIKKKLFFDEMKQGKKQNNITKNLQKNKTKINKKVKENQGDLIDDKIVCSHLLLNSYFNISTKDFLPEKTVEQRINTMREKIISIFPDLNNSQSL